MQNDPQSGCSKARPHRLKNHIQNYAWGTKNEDAYIPNLLGIHPEADQTYAELWMGVHPNAPSDIMHLEKGEIPLSDWLSESPEERLGHVAREQGLKDLPYLFKVLSANEALSIQAHPDKLQAEKLHRSDPEHYPDNNHKPEVAIAIDQLDALVGFISDEAFHQLLPQLPELETLLDHHVCRKDTLKSAIDHLFDIQSHEPSRIQETTQLMHQRLQQAQHINPAERLFLEQYEKQGPGDIGLLFLFCLNWVHLSAGEAIFLAPGVPHAYLKGNIIECMANSDNVVRLGLTGKYCDIETLKEILVYDESLDYRIPQTNHGFLSEYQTPANEFTVKTLKLPQGESVHFTGHQSLIMHLVISGDVSLHWGNDDHSCSCIFKQGDSFITPANLAEFKITSRQPAQLYLVEIP